MTDSKPHRSIDSRTPLRRSTLLRSGLVALGVLAASACAQTGGDSLDTQPSSLDNAAASQENPRVDLEAALRNVELGRDLDQAREVLAQAAGDGALSAEDRTRAAMALSRVLEAKGENEAAIQTLEKLLGGHSPEERWEAGREVEDRLYKLVTGAEPPKHRPRFEDEPISALARALAPGIKPEPDGSYEISIVLFGGSKGVSDRLGTYNIGGALHDSHSANLGREDDELKVHTGQHRTGGWTNLPRFKKQLGHSLVVFYFDLAEGRVPARYESELPLPSAEIVSALEAGDGLIAAKARPGAPPVLLVAAPRGAQLEQVEERLAALNELPQKPLKVEIKASLTKQEIQSVIRSARVGYKQCYETLLKTDASAEGKLNLQFAISGEGSCDKVVVDIDGTLETPEFRRCAESVTEELKFPPTGVTTTVHYPISFSP